MGSVSEPDRDGAPPTVHLVASGGGHVELLRAVLPALAGYRRVWVVDEARVDRLRSEGERVHALPQYDRNPVRGRYLRNAARALAVVLRERPRIVISTGAGGTVPFCLFARLRGARLIFIETMARVTTPSASGKVLSRLASDSLVQWPEELAVYPRARLCRPALLEGVRGGRPPAGRGTFVAVGTHTQPFDRLLRMVEGALERGRLPQPVLAQVGASAYRPRLAETHVRISAHEVERAIQDSQYVVCHAGSGLMSAALRAGRRPLVLPRLAANGEHFDDHQEELAAKLAGLNLAVRLSDEIGPAELARATAPLPDLEAEGEGSVGAVLSGVLPGGGSDG
jgi:UDP-N-acetylglucosamine--N-acetylmuramyl-(pentapeptide) pyrophosphoryl-undecaprenol N-acetylglucosamine transferase